MNFLVTIILAFILKSNPSPTNNKYNWRSKYILSGLSSILSASLGFQPACGDTRLLSEFSTSGIIFKDTLRVTAISDPKLPAISIFLTDYEKPVTEKFLSFDDPATSSITCVRTAHIDSTSTKGLSNEGEEVFEENKNLLFKVRLYERLL